MAALVEQNQVIPGGNDLAPYLAALAAPTPVPAGGTAAAVTAAQGAALLAMAARITAARGPRAGAPQDGLPAADRPDLAALAAEAEAHANALLALAAADSRAFTALLAARRARRQGEPSAADAQSTADAQSAAQRAVIEIPLAVCDHCHSLLAHAVALARVCRDSVAPDAWAGVQLLVVGARISLSNARLNLGPGDTAEGGTADGGMADGGMATYAVTVSRTATALDQAGAAAAAAFAHIHEGGRQ